MATGRTFRAFFSHAGHDARTDVALIDHCSVELEKRAKSRLQPHSLDVWRAENEIRAGQDWRETYLEAARDSHFLIVVLTPGWMASKHCRAEYNEFRKIEKTLPRGDYILPIVTREISELNLGTYDDDDMAVYNDLKRRQRKSLPVEDFLNMTGSQRDLAIEAIAGEFEAMIARRLAFERKAAARAVTRTPVARPAARAEPPRRTKKPIEFPAHDYLQDCKVFIEPRGPDATARQVFAQVDFVERLYILDAGKPIDFGVYRVTLALSNEGPGRIERAQSLENHRVGTHDTYYLDRSNADKILVQADAPDENGRLGEQALQPCVYDNYHATIAVASPEVEADKLRARIEVSVSTEGLCFPGARAGPGSPRLGKLADAVLARFIEKNLVLPDTRRAVREFPVTERGKK